MIQQQRLRPKDVSQQWTPSYQRTHLMKVILATKSLNQKKKVQSILTTHKKQIKKEEIRKQIQAMHLRPSHDEGTTTQLQEKAETIKTKRKKMAAANSVRAETKIAESTRMKKIIISPKRTTKTLNIEVRKKIREEIRFRNAELTMAAKDNIQEITNQLAGKI